MITDIVDHGDGDVRSGGRNAPTTPPAPVLPRPVRVLLMVRRAKALGMSVDDALYGTVISRAQFDAWLADEGLCAQAKAVLRARRKAKQAPGVGSHKEGGTL